MSTCFLYHAFGLHSYDYVRQSFVHGSIAFTVRPKPVRCPNCRSFDVIRRGSSERKLRTVPIGGKPIWLMVVSRAVAL
jgi:hypothetical protein